MTNLDPPKLTVGGVPLPLADDTQLIANGVLLRAQQKTIDHHVSAGVSMLMNGPMEYK